MLTAPSPIATLLPYTTLFRSVLVLEHRRHRAVEDALRPGGERRAVTVRLEPVARGLNADELHVRVVEERGRSEERRVGRECRTGWGRRRCRVSRDSV